MLCDIPVCLLMQPRCVGHHSQPKDSWRGSLELPGPLGTPTVPGRGGVSGVLQKGGHTKNKMNHKWVIMYLLPQWLHKGCMCMLSLRHNDSNNCAAGPMNADAPPVLLERICTAFIFCPGWSMVAMLLILIACPVVSCWFACRSFPTGSPLLSHWFPVAFQYFPTCFPMISCGFPPGFTSLLACFLVVSCCFPHYVHIASLHVCQWFLIASLLVFQWKDFGCFPIGFSLLPYWFPIGFLLLPHGFPIGFPSASPPFIASVCWNF